MSANTFCIAGNYILRKFHSIKNSVSNSFSDQQKLFYYRGNYGKNLSTQNAGFYRDWRQPTVFWFAFLEQFKKMYVQKVKEQEKAYNKQVH